jgi:hypothetical protein
MYIASLLGSVATESRLILNKPYLSSYDFIIRSYIETHPGTRCEYQVYKDNADFGLIYNSFFSGYEHEGSYFQRVLSDRDENPRIAFYYKLAASALVHLRGVNNALVHVLYEIGKHIREIAAIIRKVAGDYFDIIGRLSEGSLFHLQKELDQAMQKSEYMKKLDEFLKLLSEYKAKALPELKEKIVGLVSDLKILSPRFSFDATIL